MLGKRERKNPDPSVRSTYIVLKHPLNRSCLVQPYTHLCRAGALWEIISYIGKLLLAVVIVLKHKVARETVNTIYKIMLSPPTYGWVRSRFFVI